MRTVLAFIFAGSAAIGAAAYIGHGVLAGLELATKQQCLTQDWPAHQDKAHRDFCRTYNYPVSEHLVTR